MAFDNTSNRNFLSLIRGISNGTDSYSGYRSSGTLDYPAYRRAAPSGGSDNWPDSGSLSGGHSDSRDDTYIYSQDPGHCNCFNDTDALDGTQAYGVYL